MKPLDPAVYLTAAEAAVYVRCKSTRAYYEWRKRHGIPTLGSGLVLRSDLDRALRVRRGKWRMAAASLENLKRRAG